LLDGQQGHAQILGRSHRVSDRTIGFG
jgi:hypothetical protein